MGNFELSYENDTEIVETIKNIILNRHPIVENRIDVLFDYPRPAMDIRIIFYKNKDKENEKFTQVMFCDGDEIARCSIPEGLNIKGLISTKTLFDLISFILSDHECITNIYRNSSEIELSFDVNMKEDAMTGISCSKINLSLNFYRYPDNKEILHYYLTAIVSKFYEQLKYTESFKREYNRYCDLIKKNVIDSLKEEDLYKIVNSLNCKELREILFSMSNDRFFELYIDLENQKENIEKKLINVKNT